MSSALSRLALVLVPTLFIIACSDEQTTNFQEDRAVVKKVNLRVEGDATQTADATAADASSAVTADEMAEVFDNLDGATDGATDGSAGATDGATDGSAGATDGATDGTVSDSTGGGDGATDGGGAPATNPPSSTPSSGDNTADTGSTGGNTSTGGSSDTSTGGTVDNSTGGSTDGEAPTSGELAACSKLHGVKASRIKVVGNGTSQSINLGYVAAIKVAGNKSHLQLNLEGSAGMRLAGICLFVTGNQGKAEISSNIDIGKIVYVGRGNHSSGSVDIEEGATLQALNADLGGNQARLEMKGEGRFPCETVRTKGNGAQFVCQ